MAEAIWRCKGSAQVNQTAFRIKASRRIDPQIELHISVPPENNGINSLEPGSYRLSLDLCATPALDRRMLHETFRSAAEK